MYIATLGCISSSACFLARWYARHAYTNAAMRTMTATQAASAVHPLADMSATLSARNSTLFHAPRFITVRSADHSI